MLKKIGTAIICLLFLSTILFAQDYVNVTFRHYPISPTVVRAFVPGTFNDWGPNSNGRIAIDAPSLMTYVDSLGCYVKTVRLVAGSTYEYKFHEHRNESGSDWVWFTDPLNPLIDYSDNNNSVLNVKKAMIFETLPKNNTVVTELEPTIVAGVFSTEDDSILLDQSTIYLDGSLLTTFEGHLIQELSILHYKMPVLSNGSHEAIINVVTKQGESSSDTIYFTVQINPPIIEELPEGIVDGINYINDSTVTLCLFAPHKHFVYVIGDFTNWQIDPAYYMKLTPDSSRFWLTVSGLEPQKEYIFQYLVDGELRIADPYSEKISDPVYDQWISDSTYPDLISYPTGKTTEIASVLQTGQVSYQWQVTDFKRPKPQDLVIYELLLRDFVTSHDYKTLSDTLGYFERLGVNAIELMPINEFEGNESWGYNPSFYFAPDKYYGPKNDLKKFIDEAHKCGIAVIQDIVLNHAYGQCPLVRLYASDMSQSPWFNVTSPNPMYSWGYDFNHESEATQMFVDSVTSFWLQEYHVDGFRFDFTKGFTNRPGDGWARDNSRISILKRIADKIWEIDSTAYIILEHFTENSEEQELADYGMMLWGNMNIAYSQSAMGWLDDSQRPSDLSWGYYKTRGWSKPHLVTYMESHDEPWLMYKNLQWGRSSGDYDIKDLSTALDRIKLVAAFFFTLPGPKMMWQFGELGYDQYLPESGPDRCAPKPILWNYYYQPNRRNLYETIAALIKLRNENKVFRNPYSHVQMLVGQGQYGRRINISDDSMNVTIIGNFDVTDRSVNPNFQKTGEWYDYFSGDTIIVVDTQAPILLAPGEFHIYTDVKLETPDIKASIEEAPTTKEATYLLEQNYPNPFTTQTAIKYELTQTVNVRLEIFNLLGQRVRTLVNYKQTAGQYQPIWDGLTDDGRCVVSGLYLYRLQAGNFAQTRKMLLLR